MFCSGFIMILLLSQLFWKVRFSLLVIMYSIFDFYRRCAFRDVVAWGAPHWCDGRMVWSSLVDYTFFRIASHNHLRFGASNFIQACWWEIYLDPIPREYIIVMLIDCGDYEMLRQIFSVKHVLFRYYLQMALLAI